ncbi:hypothetical protein XELAEV_18047861mg [Xenopus laevis]|uniref:Uncharacterized protein n=1 Tax=Xenopus laevis TaxID=8355 RepID=A0A974H2A9_XENLA|nr:hypothetical protein XELAEV_18047861mg [Xenopus laevis]
MKPIILLTLLVAVLIQAATCRTVAKEKTSDEGSGMDESTTGSHEVPISGEPDKSKTFPTLPVEVLEEINSAQTNEDTSGFSPESIPALDKTDQKAALQDELLLAFLLTHGGDLSKLNNGQDQIFPSTTDEDSEKLKNGHD